MSRLATAGVLVAVLLVAVVGALIVASGQRPRPPVAGSPLESVGAQTPSTPATASPATTPRSARGPAYDPAVSRAPTAQPPQSKLWFAQGRWWGVLAGSEGMSTIHWLDWRTQEWHDTNTLVDDRPGARADVLWTADHLYVATAGSRPTAAADAIRVLRFSYEAAAARYILDDGFPVTVTAGGADDATIARDGGGRLWLSYLGADGLAVRNSVGDDRLWSAPFRPSVPAGALPAEDAAIVAQPDRTVLVWTAASENAMYSAIHPSSADPSTGWTVTRTAVEGLVFGTDQMDVKASTARSGPVLTAIRTSLSERDAPNPRDPQVILLRLQADGGWAQHVVSLVTDHGAWPVIALDEERSEVIVFSVAPGAGGRIYAKTAPLDGLDFGVGIGSVFVASDRDAQINRPTTTKQPVSAASGLVALGADDRTGHYVHGAASLGGQAPGSGDGAQGSPGSGEAGAVVFSDVFDPYPVGAPVANGWELSDPGTGELTIADSPSLAGPQRAAGGLLTVRRRGRVPPHPGLRQRRPDVERAGHGLRRTRDR